MVYNLEDENKLVYNDDEIWHMTTPGNFKDKFEISSDYLVYNSRQKTFSPVDLIEYS